MGKAKSTRVKKASEILADIAGEQSAASAQSQPAIPVETATNRPDCLVSADFAPPSSLRLRFADKEFVLPIERLEMPMDRINWASAVASLAGEKMTVTGIKGDAIPIDSSVLRYLVDAEYAMKIDKSLATLRLSRDELADMARSSPPPPEWYDEPEQDLTRESWK